MRLLLEARRAPGLVMRVSHPRKSTARSDGRAASTAPRQRRLTRPQRSSADRDSTLRSPACASTISTHSIATALNRLLKARPGRRNLSPWNSALEVCSCGNSTIQQNTGFLGAVDRPRQDVDGGDGAGAGELRCGGCPAPARRVFLSVLGRTEVSCRRRVPAGARRERVLCWVDGSRWRSMALPWLGRNNRARDQRQSGCAVRTKGSW